MSRLRVGTSGYAYKEWKGRFYPETLKEAEMLRHYAQRFAAVEINNTFYRMPAAAVLERWREETPDGFTFVLKAPQRITHRRHLADAADALAYFLETSLALRDKRGPLLFQLPPYAHKDVDGLRQFLRLLPDAAPAAFEFRHESWSDPAVVTMLTERGMTVCVADTDESPAEATPLPAAPWAYVRLRRAAYSDEALAAWATRLRAFDTAYAFFKHEDEGRGPELAARLLAVAG